MKLPDTEQYVNRIEIMSETSNRVYIVSQRRTTLEYLCSCPAGKTRKMCKHIRAVSGAAPKKNDILSGYKTNNGARGNADEWARAARDDSNTTAAVVITNKRRLKV